jgi:hypothetical protein
LRSVVFVGCLCAIAQFTSPATAVQQGNPGSSGLLIIRHVEDT